MRELRDDSLVDLKFMMKDSGMGKTFIYSEIKKGRLPVPHKIGSASRWVYADYQNWKRSHFSPIQNVSWIAFAGINAGIKFFTSVIHHKSLYLRHSLGVCRGHHWYQDILFLLHNLSSGSPFMLLLLPLCNITGHAIRSAKVVIGRLWPMTSWCGLEAVLQPRGNRIVIISYTCGIATKIRRITAGFIYDLRTALTFFIFTVSELSKDFCITGNIISGVNRSAIISWIFRFSRKVSLRM